MLRKGTQNLLTKSSFFAGKETCKASLLSAPKRFATNDRTNPMIEYQKELVSKILTDPSTAHKDTRELKLLQSFIIDETTFSDVLKIAARMGAVLDYKGHEVGNIVKNAPVRVAVTGAAGQIGYSLIPRILSGELFGPKQPVIVHLIEREDAMKALEGVAMEIEDCSFPLCAGIVTTSDLSVGFKDINYAFLVGAKPRGPGMERGDLLKDNANIFKVQGQALNDHASKDCLTLVVGNPANTNALVASANAPKLSPKQFSAMMRLDHQRALAQISLKTGTRLSMIDRVIIWGNHSATQYPDITHAVIRNENGQEKRVMDVVADEKWVQSTFIPTVQKRGAAIIDARGSSSAASAADAALKHMRDWALGSNEKWVSMAVPSDGSYSVKDGVYCSYPVVCKGDGKYEIVQGLELDKFSQEKFKASVKELFDERKAVEALLKGKK